MPLFPCRGYVQGEAAGLHHDHHEWVGLFLAVGLVVPAVLVDLGDRALSFVLSTSSASESFSFGGNLLELLRAAPRGLCSAPLAEAHGVRILCHA